MLINTPTKYATQREVGYDIIIVLFIKQTPNLKKQRGRKSICHIEMYSASSA